MANENSTKIENQPCPMCKSNGLTLIESETEVPFFGQVYVFSMNCSNCKYKKADIEAAEQKEPSKYVLEISSEEDLNARFIKSSQATVKIPRITTITPGPASEGYISNIEGLLKKVKEIIEQKKESLEEKSDRIKAIKLIKKINKILFGQEKIKITIEDPSGNSAIISDKAVKSKL
uniref:ZPR1-related zinc finger protein n=1 Tax=uncultured marine group II/III euryarchaeote KM3_139_C07 TaxID=1457870 RepID=A0A075GAZ5_9EURY|nr:ZPR1-related zinc finger protein [uncultured marine group II/III euryarchaeote KM3_139_C07]